MLSLLVPLVLSVPLIDVQLSGQSTARVGDIVSVNINIVAQQDKEATAGVWAGVDVILGWDPAVLEPLELTICESLYDYFLVTVFMSDNPKSLFFGCLNQGDGDFPDNDGDLHITFFSPLGTEQNVFAIPATLGTVEFRVLETGNHTVSLIPEVCGVETEVLRLGNVDVTGDLTDTYTVEVRNQFDVADPPGVGIEDFLALLAAWGQ